MKILYLITHPFLGGAQKYVLELMQVFKNKGLDIYLATGQKGWLVEKAEELKIPVIFFNHLKRSFNPLKNLFLIFEVKKFLDKNKFDIVHLNSSNSLLAVIGIKLAKNKSKTVFTLHGLSIIHPNWRKSFFIKLIYYLIFKILLILVDKIIFVCFHDLNYCLKIKLTKKEKAFLIYNGITQPEFLEKSLAKKYIEGIVKRPLEKKLVIGTISRLEYQKDIENLVKVAKIINRDNLIWLVIGDGPDKKKIEKLIKNLKLENKFLLLGNLPKASSYLKSFDIFVLASRCEGFPLVILEAMLAKIPIIATKSGGLPEMIENEKEGLLVKAENPKELSEAIIRLLENPGLAKILAERADQKVKTFSLEKMVEKTFNLYQNLKNE